MHERGAPHMIDPSRLMASATRLYGADMERLWGEMLPGRGGAGAAAARRGASGRRPHAGGRLYPRTCLTPRQLLRSSSRIAFVGDIAGIRRGQGNYILPPTPPPDIDLEAWRARVRTASSAWDPDTLFLTHFGPFHGVRPHFQELFERLQWWSELVRRLLVTPR